MSTKNLLTSLSAVALSVCAFSSHAALYSFEYNDTVLTSNITGISVGNAAKITVNLDNGGASLLNQTWTSADLHSVVFDFNNGGLLTTFTAPFGGSLSDTAGNFVTDAGGNLSAVLSEWTDSNAGTDFSTNGDTPTEWFLNGGNGIYYNNFDGIDLTNVANMLTATSWQNASAVPVPAAVWLMGSGLIGLVGLRKKRA